MSDLNPYSTPVSTDRSAVVPPPSRWRCFSIYAVLFATVYAAAVATVAGTAVIDRFRTLSSIQRFEYGFQLVDGLGMAMIATTPVWLLAHRWQNTSLRLVTASFAAAVTYLFLFLHHAPSAFTWAVHGIPIGAARPFWPITGGMLLCSATAVCVALPIVGGHRMLRQSALAGRADSPRTVDSSAP